MIIRMHGLNIIHMIRPSISQRLRVVAVIIAPVASLWPRLVVLLFPVTPMLSHVDAFSTIVSKYTIATHKEIMRERHFQIIDGNINLLELNAFDLHLLKLTGA